MVQRKRLSKGLGQQGNKEGICCQVYKNVTETDTLQSFVYKNVIKSITDLHVVIKNSGLPLVVQHMCYAI